jgi:hypothetical protein
LEEHITPVFRAEILKIEALCCSKMLVSAYKSTWNYNQEDEYGQIPCPLADKDEADRLVTLEILVLFCRE